MDYSFMAPKSTRPGHESRVRPANVVWYRYRLVSGARAGRSRSRRIPAPLRSVAGRRYDLGWTGPFVSRAVAPRADRLPATVTWFRLKEPPALPRAPGLDLRSVPYLPSFATSHPTPAGPARGWKASIGSRAGRQGPREKRQRPRVARQPGAGTGRLPKTPPAGRRSPLRR